NASMRGTTNPARLEQISKLEREFRAFTKIFADIVRIKEEGETLVRNSLTRSETSLGYKLDELASTAQELNLEFVIFQAKSISTQFQAIKVLANNFVVGGDLSASTSALSRLKFLENGVKGIPATSDKIEPLVKEMPALITTYREALTKL